jgi:NADH-quinone oxidoreductase subunit N
MTVSANDILAIMPFILATLGGLVVILLDVTVKPQSPRRFLGGVCLVFLAAMLVTSFSSLGNPAYSAFYGLISADDFGHYLGVLFAIAGSLAVLIAMGRLPEKGAARGEFYALLLFATGGANLLAQATDLVTLFIGLETLSIPAYILAATMRRDPRSAEAGFKYFILGAFSTGFLIYGIALLYGAAGSTQFADIAHLASSQPWNSNPLLVIGAVLILVGLSFKIAAVPFHMWAPDVYQGSPTPATAFFATAVKAAAFAALLRILYTAIPAMKSDGTAEQAGWFMIFQVMAILTMVVANLIALVQTDVKRLLAYSSVAHAGYLIMGLLADSAGAAAIMFYLAAYTFMTVGAFALVAFFEHKDGGTTLKEYAGLGRRHPVAAVALAVFLFSLAGIPPTAGFFGKFYLFRAALENGLVGLTIVAVMASLVSAYYYLRVIVAMFMDEKETSRHISKPAWAISLVVGICLLLILAMGVYPSPYLDAAKASIAGLF